jgi:hypothetical protein
MTPSSEGRPARLAELKVEIDTLLTRWNTRTEEGLRLSGFAGYVMNEPVVELLERCSAALVAASGEPPQQSGRVLSLMTALKVPLEHFANMERETVSTIAQIQSRIGRPTEFPEDARTLAHYQRNAEYFGERTRAIRDALDYMQERLGEPPQDLREQMRALAFAAEDFRAMVRGECGASLLEDNIDAERLDSALADVRAILEGEK